VGAAPHDTLHRRADGKASARWLWLGILAAILASVSLAGFKLVVLKMLPFDNKSEFQIVLDMPLARRWRRRPRCCARSAPTSPPCPR